MAYLLQPSPRQDHGYLVVHSIGNFLFSMSRTHQHLVLAVSYGGKAADETKLQLWSLQEMVVFERFSLVEGIVFAAIHLPIQGSSCRFRGSSFSSLHCGA
jgi:hypothetical protein